MERRVVITGIGALTPIGNNTAEFWDGLKMVRTVLLILLSLTQKLFRVRQFVQAN